jgi:uncharacterized membrane protein YfcA
VITIAAGFMLAVALQGWLPEDLLPFQDDESVAALTTSVTITGLSISLLQWLLLRRHFARSVWWMPASAIGLGLGAALVLSSSLINENGFLAAVVVILVYGLATGGVLVWLLDQRSRPAAPEEAVSGPDSQPTI